MAYLTQYSKSIPIIKFHIDQVVMTVGQDIAMDICIPEDSVADNHAIIEAIKGTDTYRFIVKSHDDNTLLKLNNETVSLAELQDGDWLVIGGVEFLFTDDGVDSIKEKAGLNRTKASVLNRKSDLKDVLEVELKEALKDETPKEKKKMTTKEFIASSRQSRRRSTF